MCLVEKQKIPVVVIGLTQTHNIESKHANNYSIAADSG
jgi:hypothetical protein